MDDVEPHVAGPGMAHDRVQIGAVVVEGPSHVVRDLGDLADVAVEDPERVGVGQHQAGDRLVRLGPQVVQVDPAVRRRRDLDDLVAGHRHRRRVRAVRGVRREHPRPLLVAVLVVRAGEEEPGELAVGAGRRLERHVRQAGQLRERALEVPHQLERALRALRVLGRMQPRVARQRRDLLVQARVVLHRAGAERVGAGVEVEVAARDPVVVADDLGLGDLGQRGGALAQELRRDQLRKRGLGDVGGGQNRRAPALDGALEDRRCALALHRGGHFGRARWGDVLAHALTSAASLVEARVAATARPSESASRSMSAFERRSVIATRSPFACSG